MEPIKRKTRPVCESGVVEGFFYEPWSHSARRGFIEFMAAAGMNTYIYAPKDDVFHRMNWTAPYPDAEWNNLLKTIAVCKKNGVEFVWAVSPGMTIHYSRDSDLELLVAKFERMIEQGVRSFCLFLDDIQPMLVHPDDKDRFASLADAHVFICNRLFEHLKSLASDARLRMCPTEYATVDTSSYLETLGAGLPPEIGVFWTGPQVVSPAITAADARKFAKIIRRKPLLWDNYPVNDYNRNILNMGPLRGRDPELPGLLDGYFANPMNEPVASCIPLLTTTDYLYDPAGYDPEKSMRAAIRGFGGPNCVEILTDFCDAWPAIRLTGQPKTNLQLAISEARTGKTAKLKKHLDRLAELREAMEAHPELQPLAAETMRYIKGLVRYADAARFALELLKYPDNTGLRKAFDRELARAEKTGANPAAGDLRSFIDDTIRFSNSP